MVLLWIFWFWRGSGSEAGGDVEEDRKVVLKSYDGNHETRRDCFRRENLSRCNCWMVG